MWLAVDGIIVLTFALCAFIGYKRGLVKSLLKLCTSIIAIIVAIVLYKPFYGFVIDNTLVDDNIQYSIEKIVKNNNTNSEEPEVEENSGMPSPIVKYVNKNLKKAAEKQKEEAITEVSKNAARLIVMLGCIIIIYIIVKILLRIITIIFDIFTKLPVIKQFNEIGGLLYGLLEAIAIIYIALTLISVATPLIGDYTITNLIEQSYLGKLFYNTNILLNLIF